MPEDPATWLAMLEATGPIGALVMLAVFAADRLGKLSAPASPVTDARLAQIEKKLDELSQTVRDLYKMHDVRDADGSLIWQRDLRSERDLSRSISGLNAAVNQASSRDVQVATTLSRLVGLVERLARSRS